MFQVINDKQISNTTVDAQGVLQMFPTVKLEIAA